MKKLLALIAFAGVLFFATPNQAKADTPCATYVMTCPDGSKHYVVCCEYKDFAAWACIICNDCHED